MIQRHMPLGYQMIEGNVRIDPSKAQTVKQIFQDYVNGTSMYEIAKAMTGSGILNASHKPVWTHGTVGKILQNQKYLGDALYPPLIEPEIFAQAQERRKERSGDLGRIMQPNRLGKRSVFSDHMICGVCGQPYRRYVEHCNQPGEKINWKCRHYINGNRVFCRNVFLLDEQIIEAFIEVMSQLTTQKTSVQYKNPPRNAFHSRKVMELTEQIQDSEEREVYSAKDIVRLIYERAQEQYRISSIHDQEYQTEKMRAALAQWDIKAGFDPELFKRTVNKIVIHKDKQLEFVLLNGRKITVPIKENTERRNMHGQVQNRQCSKEEYIIHSGESGV